MVLGSLELSCNKISVFRTECSSFNIYDVLSVVSLGIGIHHSADLNCGFSHSMRVNNGNGRCFYTGGRLLEKLHA